MLNYHRVNDRSSVLGLEYAEFLRIRVVHAEAALARCLEHVRITRSKAQEYMEKPETSYLLVENCRK